MRTPAKSLTGAFVLGATLLAASALYAHDSSGGMPMSGSMMGPSMMGPGSGMGMTDMTGQSGRMAQSCGAMMSNHGHPPNSQWQRKGGKAPPAPSSR